jgi:anti-sigma factor RsiW
VGTGAPPSVFSDADLHGLVDGCLDAARQAELHERLKSHGPERARVAAWREQNDLLKASFSEIENEPIPLSLSLTPPPRLKCITSDVWPGTRPPVPAPAPIQPAPAKRSRHDLLAFGFMAGCIGVLGCWLIAEHPPSSEAPPLVLTVTGQADGMLVTPTFDGSDSASRETIAAGGEPRGLASALPTREIPDLGASGFRFIGATVQGAAPAVLIFSYENAAGHRLALAVSTAPESQQPGPAQAAPVEPGVTWRREGIAYRLSGSLDGPRLKTIAAALQAGRNSPPGQR